jgi:hypothetical protein
MASAGRDHVIEMPKWCSAVLCLDLLVMTAILNLLFPYKGPEDTMPYLHRFTIFVVSKRAFLIPLTGCTY